MAHELQTFVERAEDVPATLRNTLNEIRQRDDSVLEITSQVEQLTGIPWGDAAPATPSRKLTAEERHDVRTKLAQAQRLSEEKVKLAESLYDFVDRHICNLDKQLLLLDNRLKADRAVLGLKDGDTACSRLGLQDKPVIIPTDSDRRKRGKRRLEEAKPVEVVAPVAFTDPAEPLYCICKKLAFGEMIACDNPTCNIEWYHYACVGISPEHPPKGKWYCPECRPEIKKKKKGG